MDAGGNNKNARKKETIAVFREAIGLFYAKWRWKIKYREPKIKKGRVFIDANTKTRP